MPTPRETHERTALEEWRACGWLIRDGDRPGVLVASCDGHRVFGRDARDLLFNLKSATRPRKERYA